MKREVFSSRAEKFFLSHKDGKENDGDDHRKERSLCNIEWVGFSQAGNKNGDTGNREAVRPAAPAKKAREPRLWICIPNS